MATPVRWLLLAFLAAPFAYPLSAQAPQAPEPSPDSYAESIDVRVVNVEAVVTDRQGGRVRGLHAADFRLLVDGKEVPIDYFTEVVDGEAAAPPAGAPDQPAAPAAGVVGRSVLVFVDRVFTIGPQLDLVLARLRGEVGRLGPEDRVAVVSFDGAKLAVLTDWTGDRAAVLAALDRARGEGTGGVSVRAERESLANDEEVRARAEEGDAVAGGRGPGNATPGLDTLTAKVAPDGTQGPATGAFGSLRVDDLDSFPWKAEAKLQRTLTAAMAALRGFAGTPGRKAVLLLSGGWPVNLQPQLFPRLIDTANRLGYTLYPVDVAGIETSPVPVGAAFFGPEHPGAPNTSFITSAWERDTHYGLEELALWTGGKASLNSARLTALDRLVDDTASYYWIGFSPAWRGDGRRHAVRLEARRGGLAVRSRRSFTDLSRAAESAMAIEGRLLLGRDTQEKALAVSLGAARWAGLREVEVPLSLGIPAGSLAFVEEDGGYRAELPLHVTSFDRSGLPVDLPPVVLRVTVRQIPPAGELMRFESVLRLRRGERRLRFTASDPIHDKLLWGEAEIGGAAPRS